MIRKLSSEPRSYRKFVLSKVPILKRVRFRVQRKILERIIPSQAEKD